MTRKCQRKNAKKIAAEKSDAVSYRLKCSGAANGLSHFAMYGDLDKKQALL